MGIAFLLLGLVPLIFLPHGAVPTPDDEGHGTGSEEAGDASDLLVDLSDPADLPISDAVDILSPVDPIDLPDDGTQSVDWDAVLQPVDDMDIGGQNAGDVGEVLQPVDQIDAEGETIFVDVNTAPGLACAEVEGFESGLDTLHVTVTPELVTGDLNVEVIPTENGLDALVYVEQQLVAILKSAPEACRDDIVVEIERLVA